MKKSTPGIVQQRLELDGQILGQSRQPRTVDDADGDQVLEMNLILTAEGSQFGLYEPSSASTR